MPVHAYDKAKHIIIVPSISARNDESKRCNSSDTNKQLVYTVGVSRRDNDYSHTLANNCHVELLH